MANYTISSPPVFADAIRRLETTDRQHADTFNAIYEKLLNNDAWLRDQGNGKEALIKNANAKTTLVDADTIPLSDSAASSDTKKITFANLKKALQNTFDATYKYTHPSYTAKAAGLYKVTVDATGHISTATAVTKADITALGIPASNTTYAAMTAATASAAGKAGLVPAPAAGAQAKFLRGDGTWQTPPDTNTTYTTMKAATSSAAGAAGLVPAPAAGAQTKFLRGDGTWQPFASTVEVANKVGTATKGSETKPIYLSAGTPTVCSRDLIGMTMTGSVRPTSTTTVTARNGAEIFNDYRERTFSGISISRGNVASGEYSHAEGARTTASGSFSHAEGCDTEAIGSFSHAEGYRTTARASYSHAEGELTRAYDSWAHAGGCGTYASGEYAFAHGLDGAAFSDGAVVFGNGVQISNYCAFGCGKFPKDITEGGAVDNTTGDVFVIGKGTSTDARANAIRITYAGKIYACASLSTSGADYAEFFEWEDGNPENEDRVGYFVTTRGKKIQKAGMYDYIVGVTSGNPAVIGNGDEDWQGRYLHDEMNRPIKEEVITPVTKSVEKEVLVLDDSENPVPKMEIVIDEKTGQEVERQMVDEEGNPAYETRTEMEEVETGEVIIGWKHKENPDYDHTKPYVERQDRPEWDCVGMVGVLSVYDDGTCQVNGFCKPATGGIATAAESQVVGLTYRVIERVSKSVVKIIFR